MNYINISIIYSLFISLFISYLSFLLLSITLAIYVNRHPPPQLPMDPSKKNLVVLGSGWGASSFIKKLDTENYNVVSYQISFFSYFFRKRKEEVVSQDLNINH